MQLLTTFSSLLDTKGWYSALLGFFWREGKKVRRGRGKEVRPRRKKEGGLVWNPNTSFYHSSMPRIRGMALVRLGASGCVWWLILFLFGKGGPLKITRSCCWFKIEVIIIFVNVGYSELYGEQKILPLFCNNISVWISSQLAFILWSFSPLLLPCQYLSSYTFEIFNLFIQTPAFFSASIRN